VPKHPGATSLVPASVDEAVMSVQKLPDAVI
jgi:hypothetical protein